MKFIAQLSALLLVVTCALADTVSYDSIYDNSFGSLATVACSDGPHGLLPRFSTFGHLPTFPYIGGAKAVGGYDSPNCGSCWQLSFNGNSINVLAIDQATDGFNIAREAMDALIGGQADSLGRIDAVATRVEDWVCGV